MRPVCAPQSYGYDLLANSLRCQSRKLQLGMKAQANLCRITCKAREAMIMTEVAVEPM